MNELKHLAIILDGNGRWAQEKGKKRIFGHKEGLKNLYNLVNHISTTQIKYLSIFCFSTENWTRPKLEVEYLMRLFHFSFKKILKNDNQNIRIVFSNSKTNLDNEFISLIKAIETKTKDNKGLVLNICFNYGSRLELLEMTKEIANKVKNENLEPSEITYDIIRENLYVDFLPDVDLLIRPGKEKRLSNFLLYQLSYAELYFTDVYFPSFDHVELNKALNFYQSRKRRFGGLNSES